MKTATTRHATLSAARTARLSSAKSAALASEDAFIAYERLTHAAEAMVQTGALQGLKSHVIVGHNGQTGYRTIIEVVEALIGGDITKLDTLDVAKRRRVLVMARAVLAHVADMAEFRVDPQLGWVAPEVLAA